MMEKSRTNMIDGYWTTLISNSSTTAPTCIFVASSSFVLLSTWKFVMWKARKRARELADQVQRMVQNGPMVDCSDPKVRTRLLQSAMKRASKWLSFQSIDEAQPLPTQVGGMSVHRQKRPVLALAPDYALKPLHTDDRGFREIAFYEALKLAEHGGNSGGSSSTNPSKKSVQENNQDLVTQWLAVFVRGHLVAESELALVASRRRMRKEIDLLRRLSNFTPSYYGVIGQPSLLTSTISPSAYLLLHDATINFSKPCVLDLKLGQQSYEPDASPQKIQSEIAKYVLQSALGFRIVGMRLYDPASPQSDPSSGFRTFDKTYGRSLTTERSVMDAIRLFFQQIDLEETQIGNVLEQRRHKMSSYDVDQFRKNFSGKKLRSRVITNLLPVLQKIRKWFEDNTTLCFYSSSILIVYEGDVTVPNWNNAVVRMIDFGHVRRESKGDAGYLYGLKTFIKMLNRLLAEETAE